MKNPAAVALGRLGGKATSESKTRAVRENPNLPSAPPLGSVDWEMQARKLMEVLSPFALYAPALRDVPFFEDVLKSGNQGLMAGAFRLAEETMREVLIAVSPNH